MSVPASFVRLCRPFGALSLAPRVRGRRVAWRRSSPVRSFLRVACVRGGCSGRVLVVVHGVVRSGGSGRGGGSVRWRVRLTSASSCWGRAWVVRRAVPFFRRIPIAVAGPRLRAAKARPLRRDQPRGVFKRQRRLAKRGYANDQGLTKPQSYANGFGGSSHYTPRRKPTPVPIGYLPRSGPERPAGRRAYGTDDHRRCWRLALHP